MCKFSAIKWSDALRMFEEYGNTENEFCKIASKIYDSFDDESMKYVYLVSYDFGDKLICNGKFPIDCFKPKSMHGSLSMSNLKFAKDLSYSENDPLGFVLNNHIEVYSKNTFEKNNHYSVPLNIIIAGELFGLFGTLDYLSDNKTKTISKDLKQDWAVVAGNKCFEIFYPFAINKVKNIVNKTKGEPLIGSNTEKVKTNVIKEYIKDHLHGWSVDVIYFPEHFLVKGGLELSTYLYKIGWQQSFSLRNFSLENKVISDIVLNKVESSYKDLKFQGTYINFLCHHIIKSFFGETYVLKPITNENHILKQISEILHTEWQETGYYPIMLSYDKLSIKERDWGLIIEDKTPILLQYQKFNLNELCKLFSNVSKALIDDKTFFNLPEVKSTIPDGAGEDRYKMQKQLRQLLADRYSISEEKLPPLLSKTHFSNFLIIKNER